MSIKKINKEILDMIEEELRLYEATDTGGSSGSFRVPMSPGMKLWDKDILEPFTVQVSKWDDAQLAYDSYDGKLDVPLKTAKKMEAKAKKIELYQKNHPQDTDDNGNNINGGNGPDKPVGPFNTIVKEDLGVWFGTKKKPKGSKQPKGPWVNICRKKEGGGHPPCGRPDASDKAYPKCRAAGVAAKMTDAQKRSACQQKRKAEKLHSKAGTGNKPKMTHYEPRNESLRDIIKQVLRESFG
jgi:hypothetical protein